MSVMQFDSVELAPGVEDAVPDLAGRCDLLLFGELHGPREVPALVGGLLNKLHELGYGGLGLEAPSDQRQALADWAPGQRPGPPPFYAEPSRDGRGSTEALDLVKRAAVIGWATLCFDQSRDPVMQRWAEHGARTAY